MKYECLIFTISILILSTSCKKKEDAIPEINVKRNNSTQERKENLDKNEKKNSSILTPAEVKTHIGDSLTVRGYIADIHINDKVAYLNFENKYPKNIFSCTIFQDKFSEFGNLAEYKGKTVEVSGRISEYRGKPQMILNSVIQINILK